MADDVMTTATTVEPAATAAASAPRAGDGSRRAFEASLEFFLAPLMPLIRDPAVSEIMVNGPDNVYVERKGRIDRAGVKFASEQHLLAAANNLAQFVGQTVDRTRPLMDGRMPDGSRVCVVLGHVAASGTCINIRRFSRSAVRPEFLLEQNAITAEAMEFLTLAVRAHQNLIVSGGTGSGKTTLLNVLSCAFADDERVIVIEDTRELQVQKPHVVQLEARPADANGRGRISIRDLFVTSLRMRPDRIIVGEVRRGEALDMVQAMTSGHRGSMATVHASTPGDACARLETMALMADVSIPLAALRRQVASAIDLIVQTARMPDGRRMISHIAEVDLDPAASAYRVRPLFSLAGTERRLEWSGRRPSLADEVEWQGLSAHVKLTDRLMRAPASKGADE